MKSLRVVPDTNVLLSALLFSKPASRWLCKEWVSEKIVPLVSEATRAEFVQVLRYPKFGLTDDEREVLAASYLPWCSVAEVPPSVDEPYCRDPLDRSFLALAIAGRADRPITGDKDILALSDGFPIPIVTLSTFKETQSP